MEVERLRILISRWWCNMFRDIIIRMCVGTAAVGTFFVLLYLISLVIKNFVELFALVLLIVLLIVLIYMLGYLLYDYTYKYFKR